MTATDVPLLLRQFNDCYKSDNGPNSGPGQQQPQPAQCAAALPDLFVWMNGTQPVPVIKHCNPTNPADPNVLFGRGCVPATVINGKPYYVYYPLLANPGTWTFNTACTGF